MLRKIGRITALLAGLGVAGVLLAFLFVRFAYAEGFEALGALATGPRLERMKSSPQWGGEHFEDILPRIDPEILDVLEGYIDAASEHRVPEKPPTFDARSRSDFDTPPASGLRVTWLGHSTTILEIDGIRLLIDPVWGEYAAPFPFLGVDRFHAPPLPFAEIPEVDAVVISHDHYDHLDHPTIKRLAGGSTPFLVPLGIGAHLEHWGIAPERIVELDWWDTHQLGDVTLHSTPSRHFSGRSYNDREMTLWTSWAFVGPEHRVYFSGDTAMFPGLREIGDRLGPFDLAMVESGAYNQMWADVHLGPEQAVEANMMVGGKLMMPVHWGLFDLALHGWTEPIERVLVAAEKHGVKVVSPRPGQSFEPDTPPPLERWWPDIPWQTAEEAPARSSGLE